MWRDTWSISCGGGRGELVSLCAGSSVPLQANLVQSDQAVGRPPIPACYTFTVQVPNTACKNECTAKTNNFQMKPLNMLRWFRQFISE